ncbi:DUF1574 domain-containing protein [Microcoleus sp. FACHB-1515]|uniref:DUF1574 domain-containing protein n=1 Tax=Cyanophyceae TaxID=3028117 RepID=UPI001685B16C|nr:DUF1574 domain-containing protein [Microcoleus sp. FACHB-1515]MBD2088681.1 DUF1574 domain-containing protein [Microcoleus sp. FACHB-1515]
MLNPVEARPAANKSLLAHWLAQVISQRGMRVKFQVRGNDLHILCDGLPCPDQEAVLSHLVPALEQTDLSKLLPDPPLYQAIVYGRALGQSRPSWTSTLQLHSPQSASASQTFDREPSAPPSLRATVVSSGELMLSNRSLARSGEPDGIARYLSENLSALGVAVRVKVKSIPYPNRSPQAAPLKRLGVICEANYSPDPTLISEPIAQKLRELELQDYRDAIVLIQVRGEAEPDWMLRVDLTPQSEMLREWARWGDAGAIDRLLKPMLADRGIALETTTLTDSTLHLCCRTGTQAPEQAKTVEAIAPLLQRLGPQGLHRAAIYGLIADQEKPAWMEVLKLPAQEHLALADSAWTLAQKGDWEAIAFLLNRLLNPDIDQQLATGGIHVQLVPKQDLLHVMLDAPVCPNQPDVAPTVARFLKPLNLPGIQGVRIYGRRSGQKRPLWSTGENFTPRSRLVPEATPEFAATDAYVGDLIARPDPLVLRPDLTPADVQTAWAQMRDRCGQQVQKLLQHTALFTAAEAEPTTVNSGRVALVWSLAGLLLMVQTNWLLGQVLRRPSAPASSVSIAPSEETPYSGVSLRRSTGDDQAFSSDGFTQSAPAKAAITVASPFATFNSRQIDEQLALYHQHVLEFGAPDVLVVGSSRALRGVDPSALQRSLAESGYPNVRVFNLGLNGATAQVVDLLMQRILTTEQLPRLIVWADGARAFNSGNVDVTFNGMVASEGYRQLEETAPTTNAPRQNSPIASVSSGLSESYQDLDRWLSDRLADFSAAHRDRDQVKSRLQEAAKTILPAAPGPTADLENLPNQGVLDIDGFLSIALRFNPVTYYQEYARVAGAYDSDYENFQLQGRQSIALNSLLQFTRDRQIPLVFVNLPLTDEYLDPTRAQYEQQFREFMTAQSIEQSGLTFRDLGQIWLTQYDYFSDPSHLNRYGAYEISQRLAQDLMIPWVQAVSEPLRPARN